MAHRESTDQLEKKRTLPILQDDSSNWVHYSEIITTHAKSKGLHRHLAGTVRPPADITQDMTGDWYFAGSITPLTDDELEAHQKKEDEYEQKEAKLRDLIYQTISPTRFSQIKDQKTAHQVWQKLVTLNENRGDMVQLNTLNRLQQMRCGDDDDLQKHLADMSELKDILARMGNPLSDLQFGAYIRASIPDHYRTLLTTIATAARLSVPPRQIDSALIISELTNEYLARSVDKKIDSENAAMSAVKKSGGKGKGGEKPKCTNCKKKGHSKSDCFAPGGGKEHDKPDWYVKQEAAAKKGKGKEKAAAADDDADDVALVIGNIDDDDDENNVAFLITSDFREDEAHAATPSDDDDMIVDTGATRHFSPNRAKFTTFVEIPPVPIRAADGRTFSATGKGNYTSYFPMGLGKKPTRATLVNTYYSPHMAYTLISVTTLDRAGYAVSAEDGTCVFKTPKPARKTIAIFPIIRGLYRAPNSAIAAIARHEIEASYLAARMVSISELHRRMGHCNHDDLRDAVRAGTITGVNLDMKSEPQWCEVCVQAKAARKPIPRRATEPRPTVYGGKVVTDLKGKINPSSIKGAQYAMSFTDLSTHEERPYFLKKKSDAFDHYLKYEAWVKVQRGACIRTLGSDGGGEFISKEFENHLLKAGIEHQLTVHDTPSENGIAERGQRTHIEQVRAMLIQAGLSKYLWAEAWMHSVWLRNRSPTAVLPNHKTPMEMATKRKPNLSKLLEWGTPVWVKKHAAGDLDRRANKVHFVGYDLRAKGMRLWPGTRRIMVERDVYFSEKDALTPGTASIEGEWDEDDILVKIPKEPSISPKTPPQTNDTLRNEQNRGLTDTIVPPVPENLRVSPPPESDPAPSEIPPPEAPTDTTPPPPPPHARKRQSDAEKLGPAPYTGSEKRQRKPPGFYHAMNAAAAETESSTEDVAAMFEILEEEDDDDSDLHLEAKDVEDRTFVVEFAMVTENVPMTLRQAINGPDAKHWMPVDR